MNAGPENFNLLWAELIVGELVRCGVRALCVAPGSRSGPLAIAAGRHPGVRCVLFHDERAMGYHAVGFARGSGAPAAVICTSGTAAANLLPAIVEASMDGAPMIALTADRPPELRGAGANQAIPQPGLYGEFVRWRVDLPVPDAAVPARALLGAIDHAVWRSLSHPSGPVHLNCPLRDPLAPVPGPIPASALDEFRAWREGSRPQGEQAGCDAVAGEEIERAARTLGAVRRGLIVAGRLRGARDVDAARALASALGWPLVADPTSGLRFGCAPAGLLAHFESMLGAPAFRARFRPEYVLQLGAHPVSRRYLEWIDQLACAAFEVVSDAPGRVDVAHRVTRRLDAPVDLWAHAVAATVRGAPDVAWVERVQAEHAAVTRALDAVWAGEDALSGPLAARVVAGLVPGDAGLFLGNSMPVREAGAFAESGVGARRVATNRGASGIDGTLASAHGYAAGLGTRVVAFLGDMALLHDLNSLALLAHPGEPPVIAVVQNNGGGGIFTHLPVGDYPELCDRLFVMAHAHAFGDAARMFGLPHQSVSDLDTLRVACGRALADGRSAVIEVALDRRRDRMIHRRLDEAAARALEEVP